MTITGSPGSHLRRLVPAALLAAALGTATVMHPALASARVWNITAYNDCLDDALMEFQDDYDIVHTINCCLDSGGVWVGVAEGGCKAKAPTTVERPAPPRAHPSAVADFS